MATAPFSSPSDALHAGAFFQDRPGARAVWDAIAAAAARWGPVVQTATKSRVCLKARNRFLWCCRTPGSACTSMS